MGAAQASGEWWAKVSHAFQVHVREESHFLEEYRTLVDSCDDPAVAFLIQLILDDERRHHALFEEMARSILGDGDGIPAAPLPSAETVDALLQPTEHFLAAEHEDHERLRALRRELKPARADTLWPLIVEVMEIDTRKHIRILEYVQQRLRAAARKER